MLRALCSSLLVLSVSMLATTCSADDLKAIEQELKTSYEGSVVELRPLPQPSDLRWDIPAQARETLEGGLPVHAFVERFRLKRERLELRARRIYWYQDSNRVARGIKGEEENYRLQWKTAKPDQAWLRSTLGEVLPYLREKPETWKGYWPPLPRASCQEINRTLKTTDEDLTPPECLECAPVEKSNAGQPSSGEFLEGTAVFRFAVNEDGRPTDIRTEQSLDLSFDRRYMEVLARCLFRPALRDGQPVPAEATTELTITRVPSQPSEEIESGIYRLGTDTTLPACKACPDPEYPPDVGGRRIEGKVILATIITETGRVAGIRIVKTLDLTLDQAAILAVSRWRFSPALRHGQPIRALMAVEINFHPY